MKKLALILIMAMVFITFAACANENAATETPTEAPTDVGNNENIDNDIDTPEPDDGIRGFTVSNERENIPDDADFGGYNFIIMVEDPSEKVWTYTNMVVEELTGDAIDDAFFRRNRLVEERLNINISQRIVSVWGGATSTEFRREVASGAGSFDIALISYGYAARLALGNYCFRLNEVPYIDLDKPWWDQGSRRDLSIANHNFLMASDITIADNDNTWLIYFDKQLREDLGLENPYDLVHEGRWTFDKMLSMMRDAEMDMDGSGVMTMNDRFGLLTHGENFAGLWIAAGQRLITKNADDMPEIAFGDEMFMTVWQSIIEIMNDTSTRADDIGFISRGLADGQTLFANEILKFVRDYRGNDREFGILPMPKFNEQQESYHTYVALSAPLLIIPISNPDIERTGIIVEAMAAEGHRTIMPAYYEVSIEGKFVRDEESIEMLNIAFATRTYDLGVVFNWGSMATQLRTLGERNDSGIASLLDRISGMIERDMERTFAVFEEH